LLAMILCSNALTRCGTDLGSVSSEQGGGCDIEARRGDGSTGYNRTLLQQMSNAAKVSIFADLRVPGMDKPPVYPGGVAAK
jgi:hypothetical protein